MIARKLYTMWMLLVSVSILGCASLESLSKSESIQVTNCPNCGMVLKEWAHTNHEFSNSEGHFRTCSIHCLADMRKKSGLEPTNVVAALHLHPEKMVPADKAVYVIGSKDTGTMTQVSKLAFESSVAAGKFVAEKGGKMATFSEALAVATKELPEAKPTIEGNRKRRGKIADPSEQDRCVVCNMPPSRYPQNNAQLLLSDKKRVHLCSTHCLYALLENPQKYGAATKEVGDVWVHDYVSGRYIFGKNAYYVVDSKVLGPMGPEAIPFDLKSDATDFAKTNGGTILKFGQVTLERIMAK